jgi:hypothetical protein
MPSHFLPDGRGWIIPGTHFCLRPSSDFIAAKAVCLRRLPLRGCLAEEKGKIDAPA